LQYSPPYLEQPGALHLTGGGGETCTCLPGRKRCCSLQHRTSCAVDWILELYLRDERCFRRKMNGHSCCSITQPMPTHPCLEQRPAHLLILRRLTSWHGSNRPFTFKFSHRHQLPFHKILVLSRNANLLPCGCCIATNNHTATTNTPHYHCCCIFHCHIPSASTSPHHFYVLVQTRLIWAGEEFYSP
jgi:hypothetical protein